MNREIIQGLLLLILLTTFTWSLNLNFLVINTTWLEIFGVVTFIAIAFSAIYTNKKDE